MATMYLSKNAQKRSKDLFIHLKAGKVSLRIEFPIYDVPFERFPLVGGRAQLFVKKV